MRFAGHVPRCLINWHGFFIASTSLTTYYVLGCNQRVAASLLRHTLVGVLASPLGPPGRASRRAGGAIFSYTYLPPTLRLSRAPRIALASRSCRPWARQKRVR